MPLYEYQCESCRKITEKIQKFSDPPLDACPACGGAVTKLFSSPAIQFKGSGFYITDYARKGDSGKSGSGDKADKADKGETKTDSASKSESSTASSSSESKPAAPAKKDS